MLRLVAVFAVLGCGRTSLIDQGAVVPVLASNRPADPEAVTRFCRSWLSEYWARQTRCGMVTQKQAAAVLAQTICPESVGVYEELVSLYRVDEAVASRCLDEMRTAACDAVLSECEHDAVKGLVPRGARCSLPSMCEDGTTCGGCSERCCQKHCIDAPIGGVGAVCKGIPGCAEGLVCWNEKCVVPSSLRLPGEGAACSLRCAVGLWCLRGVCVRPRVEGDPCTRDECRYGFVCVGGRCMTARLVGETCRSDIECIDSRWCDSVTGRCSENLPVGSTCGSGRPPCVYGTRCSSGRCTAPARLGTGSSCADDLDCEGQCLENSRCAPRLPAGSRCSREMNCLEGLNCIDNKCTPPCP